MVLGILAFAWKTISMEGFEWMDIFLMVCLQRHGLTVRGRGDFKWLPFRV
jgi:hypothetical protein